ncbi:NAD(P)/FAD-dependent oxidoreductase [Sandarakinorhabdus sp.]|uniref:flavin-containing monooxygenase n=1 Tax=Sandarakinorhabdus sp. TaxID=1916663 RepID=UPI0033409A4D
MIDRDALLEKYRAERDKRLRPEGNEQYVRLAAHFPQMLEDPHTVRVERPPVTDHVRFAMVGGGFAGLCTGARLAQAGIHDVRIVEAGGDVGGTWYWNRYPGAQCDTASIVYMPLLEETGHIPTEKYAHAPEILGQAQKIARTFGLYDKALFHTQVSSCTWDEDRLVWVIETDRGDCFTADFVGIGTGPLNVPKLPGIAGIETFAGHQFHTSRWDYGYTGGTTEGAPMANLADKRVAIIGTGATAVQCVPHLARDAQALFVVQRTPSSVDVRANGPTDPDWFRSIATPGWQTRWLENFAGNVGMGGASEDWVQDGWTDLSRRIRSRIMALPPGEWTPQNMAAAWEMADHEKMTEIRDRAASVVSDGATAEKLQAWYRQLCKRPCFHDAYLQAYNRPGVTLVDTDGQGVERIDETGLWVNGQHYAVDCIIHSTGFEVGTPTEQRAGFDPVGRGGQKLSAAWADGMRTLHGLNTAGFPNLFLVQFAQAANFVVNVPHNWMETGTTVASIVRHMTDAGVATTEPDAKAQEDWVNLLLSGPGMMINNPDCTPGYYNNEGRPMDDRAKYAVGYPAGPNAFFAYMNGWRSNGEFKGLRFG